MAYFEFVPARNGVSGVKSRVDRRGAMYWRLFVDGRLQFVRQNSGKFIAFPAGAVGRCETIDPLLPAVWPRLYRGWTLSRIRGACRFPAVAGMRRRG